MGTRWRGLLAPIDHPTGDGRRFEEFTHRDLPLPHRWQREDEEGHDRSVVVGLTDAITMTTVEQAVADGWISAEVAERAKLDPDMQAVFGKGEFFNDVSPAEMPRLAEDVAEAMLLAGKGVLGPSVGPGAAEFFGIVHPGTRDRITDEEVMTAVESGADLPVEALFTAYEIAESTLVPVPAFSETGPPFELLADDMPECDCDPAEDDCECPEPEMAVTAAASATVAALTAAAPTVPAAWFDDPALDGPTPITVDDGGRIRGHVAAWETCHAEFRDVCVAAPPSMTGYAHFHRHAVDTDAGVLAVGRLTTGYGELGTGCSCCRGKDDHACTRAGLTAATAHYDRATTLAYVRAGEDEHGIWVAGALAPDLDARDRQVLARRLVSGDWREVGGALELVEVLALSRERPGFPLPRTSLSAGRPRALVAAGAVWPRTPGRAVPALGIDYRLLGREVAAALRATDPASAILTPVTFTSNDVEPLPEPEPDVQPEPVAEPVDGRAAQVAALAAEVDEATAAERARQTAVLAGELAQVAV